MIWKIWSSLDLDYVYLCGTTVLGLGPELQELLPGNDSWFGSVFVVVVVVTVVLVVVCDC